MSRVRAAPTLKPPGIVTPHCVVTCPKAAPRPEVRRCLFNSHATEFRPGKGTAFIPVNSYPTGASKAGSMDTDVTGTFPHSGNSNTESSRTRKKQFLYMCLSQLLDQLPPHHLKKTPLLPATLGMDRQKKGLQFVLITPQDRTLSPVTPLASITFAAAFVTAVFTMSLPTAFMRRELRARFCLLVPKASMHKSICTRQKHTLQHPVHPGEHKTHCSLHSHSL